MQVLSPYSKQGYRLIACFLAFFICTTYLFAQENSTINKVDSSSFQQSDLINTRSVYLAKSDSASSKKHLYKINYWVTGGFLAAITAGNLYAIPNIIHGKKDMTDEEVLALNKNNVGWFNRWALEQDPRHYEAAYKFTDYFLPAIVVGSGAWVALNKDSRKDFWQIALMYLEMHGIALTIYDFSPLGPNFQNRVRPLSYYDYFSMADRKAGNQKNSFFSGHVADATAASFFAVKVYSDYHPEIGSKKYLYYALASIPPLFEGYMRIRALAHFPTDVLAGFGIGATLGIVVPQLHKDKHYNVQLSMFSSPLGQQGMTVRWNPQYKQHKLLSDFHS